MEIFSDPEQLNAGDPVYMEYDDNKAFGVVVSIVKELIEVDFTTELSKEKKVEKFRTGVWKKVIV